MSTPNTITQSGNLLRVEFDGIKVGLVQSVRAADDYGHEPASGIGDIHVAEYVPGMASHSLNVSAMVLRKDNMRKAGIMAVNGDEVLKGLVFDIVSIDKSSQQILRRYVKCSYVSGEVEVSKHAIVMQSAVFKALDVQENGL